MTAIALIGGLVLGVAFYWIVYRINSGVYYRIISGKESAIR